MEHRELHDKAWNLLGEKGLSMSQKIMVRANFVESCGYKNDYPFINQKQTRNKSTLFYSEIKEISSLGFETKEEAILANALFVNSTKFEINEFTHSLKFIFRLILSDSKWAK